MLKFAIILAAVAVCHVQADNQYRLYTKLTPGAGVNMSRSEAFLPDEFHVLDKTIILIHGHGGSMADDFNRDVRTEILDRGTYNVIVVDWARSASGSYSSAYSNVRSVARELTEFLRWLDGSVVTDERSTTTDASIINPPSIGIDVSEVHLVGFGLGAHVAGIASRQAAASLGTVGRITGLDPSGSGWDSRSERLRSGDALYVEVLHTDGTGLLANGIGSAIGDKDFFANGGSNQPGCFSHACSHYRAYELFAASMRGHLFGNACGSWTQMTLNLCRGSRVSMGGTDVDKPRGNQIYRINTSRTFPY